MSQQSARRVVRRGLAGTAAVALGALGLFAGGSAAYAANIDTEFFGSITIHKYENPGDGAMNPDGTGTSPTKPIGNVTFEVCHIDGINLLSPDNVGWTAVKAVTGAQLLAAQTGATLAGYTLNGCQEVTTDSETGVAPAVSDLAIGAYLVRETAAPANVIKKADPFIVTVPTPSIHGEAGDGSWVYDVNVYPKNSVGEQPVKRIEDQTGPTAAVGSKVNFSVEQIVPGIEADETYKKFTLTDTLDSRLTGDASSVTVTVGGTPLEAGDFTATVVGQTLSVVLNEGGLAALAAGEVVRIEFAATIDSIGDGTFVNQAFVNVNDMDFTPGGSDDPDPENPTNVVTSRWGQAKVTKVDPSEKGLEGAEFTVFMGDTADCSTATTFVQVMSPADAAEALTVTSGADGAVSIPGLWIGSDSVNSDGEETIGLATRCYQLVETKAPAGFVLPTGDAAKFAVVVKPGETANLEIPIENVQQEVPELPLTGAAGQTLMIAGGVALLSVAVGSVLIARRKQQA